ncbi:uncharacterized protein LOC108106200 [Drosophila eugracilis]|uniref:uncharacterized protein LOC108106200 n=1 Tax=Drosophila eugracilis TaxID=29029 RepID=UPI0007E686D7|nr:uncharacterized protein LOC108106200 [Drosophila eugracilis]
MSLKRKFSSPFEDDNQQENNRDAKALRIKHPLVLKDLSSPRASESRLLVESASTNRRNTPSRFDSSWQTLNKSEISRSQPDSSGNTSFLTCSQLLNTSWPSTKRQAKALSLVVQKSPRTAPLDHSKEPRANHFFQTSWNMLVSQTLLNDSNCTDLSENSCIESSQVTQLVPDQCSKQYLPTRQKKHKLNPNRRFVKGGYVDDFRRFLKNMDMDKRHMSKSTVTYTVKVLGIFKEFGVSMALVSPETGRNFNILFEKDQSELLKVGSRVKFFLDPNKKPFQLKNKELVYCRPTNIIVL